MTTLIRTKPGQRSRELMFERSTSWRLNFSATWDIPFTRRKRSGMHGTKNWGNSTLISMPLQKLRPKELLTSSTYPRQAHVIDQIYHPLQFRFKGRLPSSQILLSTHKHILPIYHFLRLSWFQTRIAQMSIPGTTGGSEVSKTLWTRTL